MAKVKTSKKEAPIVRLRKKAQITIPKSVVEELYLWEGDYFEVTVRKPNLIVLEPVAVYSKEYTEELDKIIAEAEADFAAGKLKSYTDVDEMIKDMEKEIERKKGSK